MSPTIHIYEMQNMQICERNCSGKNLKNQSSYFGTVSDLCDARGGAVKVKAGDTRPLKAPGLSESNPVN